MRSFGILESEDVMLIHEKLPEEAELSDMRVGFFLNAKVWFYKTFVIQLPDKIMAISHTSITTA